MPVTDRAHSPTPEELMAFVDGESTADARAAIEAHVGSCGKCRRLMNDLRSVTKSAALWAVEDAPATLQAPRTLRARSWALPALSWRPGYLVLSCGLAALVVLGVGRLVTLTPTPAATTVARGEITAASAEAADNLSEAHRLDGRAFEGKSSPQAQ